MSFACRQPGAIRNGGAAAVAGNCHRRCSALPLSAQFCSHTAGRRRAAAQRVLGAPTFTGAAAEQRVSAAAQGADLATAKRVLKRSCYLTDRGAGTSSDVRGMIEESQVAVEAFAKGADLGMLEGLWKLIYTNAFDVTGIVDLGRTAPLLKVGGIYQEYSSVEGGVVKNIVDFGLPPFLEADRGLRFTVKADFEARNESLAFQFKSAGVGDLRITSELESFITPALLPRAQIQQAILLALKEFNVTVPLVTPSSMASRGRRAFRPIFQVTYLDQDMFIGRAPQGSFIFLKDKRARLSRST